MLRKIYSPEKLENTAYKERTATLEEVIRRKTLKILGNTFHTNKIQLNKQILTDYLDLNQKLE